MASALNDLCQLHFFLSIEFSRERDDMFLSQLKYASDPFVRTSMCQCKPFSTPLASKNSSIGHDDESLKDPTYFHSITLQVASFINRTCSW